LHRRVRRALGSMTLTQGIANTGSNQACTYGLHDLGRISGVNCVNGPTTLWNQGFTIDWRGTPRGFAPRPALRSAERARCDARTPGPSPAGPAPLRSAGADRFTEFRGHSAPTWPAVPTARPPRTALEYLYGPDGGKLAVMVGQTLSRADIPLPGGAEAVFTGSGLAWYRHADHLGSSPLSSNASGGTRYAATTYAPYGEPFQDSGAYDRSFTGQKQDIIGGE